MNSDLFFDENKARELGQDDSSFLIANLPMDGLFSIGNDYSVSLPNPSDLAYTNTKEGRKFLENPELNPKGIRGMAGGIVYIVRQGDTDYLLFQYKTYEDGKQYFSTFSGLSSSLEQVANPAQIGIREGLEELVIMGESNSIIVPDLFGCLRGESDDKLSTHITHDSIKSLVLNNTPKENFYGTSIFFDRNVTDVGKELPNLDTLTVYDSFGNEISTQSGILSIDEGRNCFDLLSVIRLDVDPIKHEHYYETEFGNDVVMIPFDEIRNIWNNDWGKNKTFTVYEANGNKRALERKAYIGTLAQTTCMRLGIIDETEKRYDYQGK